MEGGVQNNEVCKNMTIFSKCKNNVKHPYIYIDGE